MADRQGVRATYERIADHFATTREYPWPEIREFCADRQVDTALDIGCGNGRHAALLVDHADHVVGVDVSRNLLNIARERAPEAAFLAGDASALPLVDSSVDLAVYIATLHHLPTRQLRRESLNELARVLDSDGRALVSAWSTTHDRFDTSGEEPTGFDTEVDWTLPDGEVVKRFYHIYAPAEFDDDIVASDLEAVESFLASGNCYAVVKPE